MVFSELYKIIVNKGTFIGFTGGDSAPGPPLFIVENVCTKWDARHFSMSPAEKNKNEYEKGRSGIKPHLDYDKPKYNHARQGPVSLTLLKIFNQLHTVASVD